MKSRRKLAALLLVSLLPLFAAGLFAAPMANPSIPLPRPGGFPFSFPFAPPAPKGAQAAGLPEAKPPDGVAQVLYLQSLGLPPILYMIDPSGNGGEVDIVQLYIMDPAALAGTGAELYRLLKSIPEADVAKLTKKKLYVILYILRDIAKQKASRLSQAFPEELNALRLRLAAVMKMDIPEDKDFAGLTTDPEPLRAKLDERRKTLDAMIQFIESGPAPADDKAGQIRTEQLRTLRELRGAFSTLEFDSASGRPLVPAALVRMVQAVPENALNEKQWEVIFRSFPMGSSLWQMRADKLWRRGILGRTKVAVLDVGIDREHPDLLRLDGSMAVVDEANFTNQRFAAQQPAPSGRLYKVGEPDFRGEHGTHVASTVLALAPEATIINIKVLDDDSTKNTPPNYLHDLTQTITAVVDGLDYVLKYNADVKAGAKVGEPISIVSMSLGMPQSNTAVQDKDKDLISRKCAELAKSGVIVVVAAGNEGPGTARRPGFEQSIVSVGAVDYFDKAADFTSKQAVTDLRSQTMYGIPSVYAYGKLVFAAKYDPAGAYSNKNTNGLNELMSGTSMAAPHVAGAMALLLSAAAQNGIVLSPEAAKQLLIDSSTPLAEANPYARLGSGGRIDVNAAVDLMLKRYKKDGAQ